MIVARVVVRGTAWVVGSVWVFVGWLTLRSVPRPQIGHTIAAPHFTHQFDQIKIKITPGTKLAAWHGAHAGGVYVRNALGGT